MGILDADADRWRTVLEAAAKTGATVVRSVLSRVLCGDRRGLEGGWSAYMDQLADRLEAAMPALREKREKAEAKADRLEAERRLKEMELEGDLPDDTDRLEQIERELEDEDPDHAVGVPAKKKPGPKGLVGGVALPLPGSDSKRR